MNWAAGLVGLCGLWPGALLAQAAPTEKGTPSASEFGVRAAVARDPQVGSVRLDGADAARAGALGEPARAALDAAGVARAPFAGSELVTWGAAGDETRVYVDGVELPALFHAGGLRTTVHPAVLRSLTLTPGAARSRTAVGWAASSSSRRSSRKRTAWAARCARTSSIRR